MLAILERATDIEVVDEQHRRRDLQARGAQLGEQLVVGP
jgi:hypothetical protein